MVEMVFNGGATLPGCPENFEEANKWADNANKDKDESHEPKWSFDCGFKLDFDGPIVDISSRFYPPKKHYGEGWDGAITVIIMGKELLEEKIQADSLDELKNKAEKFVKELTGRFHV